MKAVMKLLIIGGIAVMIKKELPGLRRELNIMQM